MQRQKYVQEVWMMWKNKHDFHLHRILSIADWLAIFGIIPLIMAAIYNANDRILLSSLAGVCFILLMVSVVTASSDVWKRDSSKLTLIDRQKHELFRYVQARFLKLSLRNNRQIDLEIEWFNGTVFALEFQSATGVIKIDNFESKISSIEKQLCSAGEFCNYVITLQNDNDILKTIQDAISQIKQVKLYAVINAEVKVTYEYDNKPESIMQFKAQARIDSRLVIPETV